MKKGVESDWAFGESRRDDRGYNQGWVLNEATLVRMHRRCDYMIAKAHLDSQGSIMEIGCGRGENAFLLSQKTGASVLGTDLCVPFIEEARIKHQHPNLSYEIFDFNAADQFKGESFDCIVGNGILHHLYHNLDAALANIRRLLKPGGRIVFLEPNLYNPYIYMIFTFPAIRRWARLEPDEMAFSKSFAIQKLKKAGYKNIEVVFRDFLLPGVPSALIQPSIVIGDILEKVPVIRRVAQSLFISADH